MASTYLPSISQDPAWKLLAEFSLSGQPGSDRLARDQVATTVQRLNLSPADLERLKAAVTGATLDAIEHSNHHRPGTPVIIRAFVSERIIAVPDMAVAVVGQPSSHGWGFFLIHKLVEEAHISLDETHHTVELFLYREGG